MFKYPRILGHELAGEITVVGRNQLGLEVGDRCSIEPYLYCGRCPMCSRGRTNCCVSLNLLGVHIDGGMQEQIKVPTRKLHKSRVLSLDHLALVEMLGIGTHAVQRAVVEPDDTALIIGGGPIGLSVAEFVRLSGLRFGLMEVNKNRLRYCREVLKMERCFDGTNDALGQILEGFSDQLPTVVFDCTGNRQSMEDSFKFVASGGKLIFVGLLPGDVTFNDPEFHRREMTLLSSRNATSQDFTTIIKLLEEKRIDIEPWITHRVAFDKVVETFSCLLDPATRVVKAVIEA